MISRKTAATLAAGALLGGGLALTVPASAASSGYPPPTPTPTVVPVTATPVPAPTPPVVTPFAGCSFTRTLEVTFDPARGRDVFRLEPSITCDRHGFVRVFVLQR